jgi:hypothetical protein
MSKSKRKSINPNQTLRCLGLCSKYDVFTFNQEDVSEFATILVNLIEESFDIVFKVQQSKQVAPLAAKEDNTDVSVLPSSPIATNFESLESHLNESDSLVDGLQNLNLSKQSQQQTSDTSKTINLNHLNLRKNRKNPIVKLLNGDILINRKNSDEDETHSIMEIFREINIQMLNSRNLHAGLELEWGETSIDKQSTNSSITSTTTAASTSTATNTANQSLSQTNTNKSIYEQESWIVNLPSVLFVCLNRYKFVKATQSSSKILEPFEFYPYIYLDR